MGLEPDVRKAKEVRAADQAEPGHIAAERKREADEHPDDADEGEPEEAVHDRRQDVLAADEAAIEQREPGEHDHHHGRRHEHPGRIAGIDPVHRSYLPQRTNLCAETRMEPGSEVSGTEWRAVEAK